MAGRGDVRAQLEQFRPARRMPPTEEERMQETLTRMEALDGLKDLLRRRIEADESERAAFMEIFSVLTILGRPDLGERASQLGLREGQEIEELKFILGELEVMR